jgi:acetate kinase
MGEILVINSGSSSLKFALFGVPADAGLMDLQLRYRGHFAGLGSRARLSLKDGEGRALNGSVAGSTPLSDVPADLDHDAALSRLLAWIEAQPELGEITAVGHRIVHGGRDHVEPVRLDDTTLATLESLVPLAPLHQPYGLAPVRALAAMRPELVQVACFDTAFHAGQPHLARIFALPRRFRDAGMIRYGFHGLSYDYINRTLTERVLPAHAGKAQGGRVIVGHLGNGASLCAIRDGVSITSTMGFTAVEG